MSSWIVTNLWLIPAVPLAVSLVILSLANPQRSIAASLAIFGQVVALIARDRCLLADAPSAGLARRSTISPGSLSASKRFASAGCSIRSTAAMLVMITFVGLCIFVFSIGYMADDKNFTRFFAYLSFFSAAMLGVVIANSLLLLFICWELVGLASYLLIGFWIEKPSAAAAAKKAFITTRIGDIGFFLGMLWLYHDSGTLLFYDSGHGCLENAGLAGASAPAPRSSRC